MNANHAAEHSRLAEKANEYTMKARQHANDRQGLWFATMARAKELQALWHWRRMSIEQTHPWAGLAKVALEQMPKNGFSRGGNFTRDTNIAQVPMLRPTAFDLGMSYGQIWRSLERGDWI